MAVLLVVTNWSELGNTGKKTGWYLPEVAHPYYVFKEHGIPVTFCSPKGGNAPMDPSSYEAFKDDKVCKELLADKAFEKQLKETIAISDVDISKYSVIFFAGGHGPMWDLPNNEMLNKKTAQLYESNGIVSAVCHGTVGLLNTKLVDGSYLISGHKITSFTNSEENAMNLMEAMPFPLETKLIEHGGDFVDGGDWQVNVQVSRRVITGQNPASATKTAQEIVKVLKA